MRLTVKEYTLDLILNAYNEASTIEKDLLNIIDHTNEIDCLQNITIVEDGSDDGTSELLKNLSKSLPIKLNQSTTRRGYSKALIDGINSSSADFIFFSDLGGKFDWKDIIKLTNELPRYEFILGVRTNRDDQLYRRLLTKGYSLYFKYFYKVNCSDPDSGFRIYKKSLLTEIFKDKIYNKHLLNSEFTIKCLARNINYKEISINYMQRKGTSRGLPIKIIPKVIYSTIINSFKIRKQLKKIR